MLGPAEMSHLFTAETQRRQDNLRKACSALSASFAPSGSNFLRLREKSAKVRARSRQSPLSQFMFYSLRLCVSAVHIYRPALEVC